MGAKKSARRLRGIELRGSGTVRDVRAVFRGSYRLVGEEWRGGTGGGLVGGLNLAGERARRRIEKRERERERVNASASLLSRHREKGEKEREREMEEDRGVHTLKYVGGCRCMRMREREGGKKRKRENGTATGWQAHHH